MRQQDAFRFHSICKLPFFLINPSCSELKTSKKNPGEFAAFRSGRKYEIQSESKPTRSSRACGTGGIISLACVGDSASHGRHHRSHVTLAPATPPEIRGRASRRPNPVASRTPPKISACPHPKATAPVDPPSLPPHLSPAAAARAGGWLAGTGGEGHAAGAAAAPGRGPAAAPRVGARAARALRRLPRLGRHPPGLHRCAPRPVPPLAPLPPRLVSAMRGGSVLDPCGFVVFSSGERRVRSGGGRAQSGGCVPGQR